MNKNNYVAIMAGGIGSRFWPASRVHRPKQFLDILGVGKSLIQLTCERFLKLCPKENIFIVTNAIYKDLVKEHLPYLTDNQILCEPSRNNTAPCVAYTAFKLQSLNPNANFVVAPSDHVILDEATFVKTVQKGLNFVEMNEALLTLGISPTRPDTGYGYIKFDKAVEEGVHLVDRFTEKPDLATAQSFVDSGNYLWNAGIFIWNVQSVLNAFETLTPDIFNILGAEKEHYNTANEQAYIDRVYPTTPSISIDYALMEKAKNVYTIPSEFGWSDLGTWGSLHAETPQDDNQNVIKGKNVMALDSNNCLVRVPNEKLVVLKDLEDYIIVDEGDVLLIYPKSKEQEIKTVTGQIKTEKGDVFL